MRAAFVTSLMLVACAPAPSPSSATPSAARAEPHSASPVAAAPTGDTTPLSSDVLALNGVIDPAKDAGAAPSLAWSAVTPSKWEAAVDRYQVVVRPSAMLPLGGHTLAFAKYLQSMHERIHPWFADAYLATLPPMTKKLVTKIEVVVDKSGAVSALGVVVKSGDRDFDMAALEAVSRAAPFEAPPDELRSSDGRVYVHWEMHRDELYACALTMTRPFILRLDPPASP